MGADGRLCFGTRRTSGSFLDWSERDVVAELLEFANVVASLLFRVETGEVIGPEVLVGDLITDHEVDGRQDTMLERPQGALLPTAGSEAMILALR